jgi:hypothetical protein
MIPHWIERRLADRLGAPKWRPPMQFDEMQRYAVTVARALARRTDETPNAFSPQQRAEMVEVLRLVVKEHLRSTSLARAIRRSNDT